MPGIEVEIAPPANWQDFERLTLDYTRRAWKDDYAERNGRQGQAQSGVDVFGYNHSSRSEFFSLGKIIDKRIAEFSDDRIIEKYTWMLSDIALITPDIKP